MTRGIKWTKKSTNTSSSFDSIIYILSHEINMWLFWSLLKTNPSWSTPKRSNKRIWEGLTLHLEESRLPSCYLIVGKFLGLVLQHSHARYSRGLWRMNGLFYVGNNSLHEWPFCSRFLANLKANKQLGQFIFSYNIKNNYADGEGCGLDA
jgi:hypothetical protein